MRGNSCPPRPKEFPVAAKDRAALAVQFGVDNVIPLRGRDVEDVLVIVNKKNERQVWVRPLGEDRDYNRLYRKDYEAIHGPVPQDYDVDHIQSKARAGQQGYKYVRLLMVKSEVNRAWGRRFESRTVQMGKTTYVDSQGKQKRYVEPEGPASIRQIDQWQGWKVQGLCRQTLFMELEPPNHSRGRTATIQG